MLFFGYTLGDESVPQEPPSPELMADMGKFVREAMDAGVIVATGAMAPTAMGVKLVAKDGEISVVDGPFAEAKEVIGGWVLYNVPTMEDAIGWSKRFLGVLGVDSEVRLRPVFGPE